MADVRSKRAILAALRHDADFSGLVMFPALGSRSGHALLQWLDRSGLALTFFQRLKDFEATPRIPLEWRQVLSRRVTQNVERTRDLLDEAQRLNSAFRAFGVTAALIKGFSLTPDFCQEPFLRHQVDFDFLVDSTSVRAAAEVLQSCGYSTCQLNESGESCFTTPLQRIPSRHDELYERQHHRQVDLHTSLWEDCAWLPVESPQDGLGKVQRQCVNGVEFLSLSLEDKFLLHVLHAFRHSFRSWVRVSWLLEISNCIANHQQDEAFWYRVVGRAGDARLTKSIFTLILGLVNRLFQSPIPPPIKDWTADATTPSLRAWLDYFALEWAISDWPGSLNNLFLIKEFIPDRSLRMRYLRSRLLPRRPQASLGAVKATDTINSFRLEAARIRYLTYRGVVHLKDIASFPGRLIRWKRALEASRRLNFDPEC
jgi:Uncharacterised nucleotidyltransferase